MSVLRKHTERPSSFLPEVRQRCSGRRSRPARCQALSHAVRHRLHGSALGRSGAGAPAGTTFPHFGQKRKLPRSAVPQDRHVRDSTTAVPRAISAGRIGALIRLSHVKLNDQAALDRPVADGGRWGRHDGHSGDGIRGVPRRFRADSGRLSTPTARRDPGTALRMARSTVHSRFLRA